MSEKNVEDLTLLTFWKHKMNESVQVWSVIMAYSDVSSMVILNCDGLSLFLHYDILALKNYFWGNE